jgi:hypothetical protein
MLADMIRQAIPDGRVTSLAATVVGDDGMIMQYLAGVGSPDVIRLIIPADRLADLNAFRDLIIDATPEAPGGR